MSKDRSWKDFDHLTEEQVAKWLNLSKRTLQGWRLKGGGPEFEKFGRSVRYAVVTLEAWIDARQRSSTSASGAGTSWGIRQNGSLPECGQGEGS